MKHLQKVKEKNLHQKISY